MISLSSEITDNKGRRARAGWVFFDGDCPYCTSLARRFAPLLEPRGYSFAPLQDPRVQELLALPPEQLLLEMRVLTPVGRVIGGADALLFLAKEIWWAWPVCALAKLPGMKFLLRAGYRWFAARRSCSSGACGGGRVSMSPGRAR